MIVDILGKREIIVSCNPVEYKDVYYDLYLIAKYQDGVFDGYVHTGSPSTVRVCTSLEECRNTIRGVRHKYKKTTEFRIVKLLTGEEGSADKSTS